MKKFSAIILCLFLAVAGGQAQNMGKYFVSMPDSMMPYLSKEQRKELMDYDKMSIKSVVVNSMGDTTKVDTITNDFMQIRCNSSRKLQMKVLPQRNQADSIICLVNTYYGPAAESVIEYYDTKWNRKEGAFSNRPITINSLMQKPDTMDESTYDELKAYFDPMLVEMSLSPSDRSLTFGLSVPMSIREKREQLNSIILQRKLNWNGINFN